VLGGADPAAITGTVITADTNFAGDIIGDVKATDGAVVLDNGADVTGASFIGDIKAEDGAVIITSGAEVGDCSITDGVTATTQDAGTADTTIATTAFVEDAASFVGKVLQVVSAKDSSAGDLMTSATLSKLNLAAVITPKKSNSAILIQVMISGGPESGNVPIFGLKRGDADIGSSGTATGDQRDGITSSGNSASNDSIYSTYLQYTDGPGTTDATTYTVTVSCRFDDPTTYGFYLNRTYSNSDSQFTARAISTITLTEIAT